MEEKVFFWIFPEPLMFISSLCILNYILHINLFGEVAACWVVTLPCFSAVEKNPVEMTTMDLFATINFFWHLLNGVKQFES